MAEDDREVSASYDMKEDAMGLCDFILQQMENIPDDDSPVVYVEDASGFQCVRADWVEETLTDGSKTHQLVLHFE